MGGSELKHLGWEEPDLNSLMNAGVLKGVEYLNREWSRRVVEPLYILVFVIVLEHISLYALCLNWLIMNA